MTNVLNTGYANEHTDIQENFIKQGLDGITIEAISLVIKFVMQKQNINVMEYQLE